MYLFVRSMTAPKLLEHKHHHPGLVDIGRPLLTAKQQQNKHECLILSNIMFECSIDMEMSGAPFFSEFNRTKELHQVE